MRTFPNYENWFGGTTLGTEEGIAHVDIRQTIISYVCSVISRTPRTAYAVRAPVAEGETREIMLLHFLLRRQLRIVQFNGLAYSSFTLLITDIAYTCVLNMTVR